VAHRLLCCAILIAAAPACQRGAAPGAAAAPGGAIAAPSPEAPAKIPAGAAAEPSPGMVRVEVADLVTRPLGGAVVLLEESSGGARVVPMIIGEAEASAIALRIGRRKFERPLTHDLIESVFAQYDIRVVKLEIDALESGVFLGRLFLQDRDGRVTKIDARPSDGIALAIGAEAPIFMSRQILEEAGEPAEEWIPEGATPGAEPAPTGDEPADPLGNV
jgi:uncharacterized protein